MAKISKDQLITAVAEQHGITKKVVANVLEAITTIITDEVSKGNDVRLGNAFGSFVAYTTKPTTKFNLNTKKSMNVPAKRVIKFKPSSVLKETIAS